MKIYLKIITLSIILSSCAFHSGLTNNSNLHNTTVQLSQNNFRVVQYVTGSSYAEYFIGIGGLNKFALIESARKNMLENANLIGSSKAVINETVEMKITSVLLYSKITVTVSAYVVDFNPSSSESSSVNEVPEKKEGDLTKEMNMDNDSLKKYLKMIIEQHEKGEISLLDYVSLSEIEVGDFVYFDNISMGEHFGIIDEGLKNSDLFRVKFLKGDKIFETTTKFENIKKIKQ
jgi:hypothetical protein